MEAICLKKKRLRQRTHKLGASNNMRGGIFLEKKSACGNVVRHVGLPKIWGPFFYVAILGNFFHVGPPQGSSDLYSRISQQRPYCITIGLLKGSFHFRIGAFA